LHTWPNRAFAAAATSQGRVSNCHKPGWLTAKTIFDVVANDMKKSWKVYSAYGKASQTRTNFKSLLDANPDNFRTLDKFTCDAKENGLPAYSFIEPDFGPNGDSQHPAYDVAAGEGLILKVYDTLRKSSTWDSTLLVITYDEHGGLYDHFPPTAPATPPNDGLQGEEGFDFRRFGPRVPAVLVSPLIARGTVFRAPPGETIDHTSVIKTLFDLWDETGEPLYLTERDQAAPSLMGVLTLQTPRRDDPLQGVTPPPLVPPGFDPTLPSILDSIHGQQVSRLPIRRADGSVETQAPSVPTTAAELRTFVLDRVAAYDRYRASIKQS
jgi:phospholipase C